MLFIRQFQKYFLASRATGASAAEISLAADAARYRHYEWLCADGCGRDSTIFRLQGHPSLEGCVALEMRQTSHPACRECTFFLSFIGCFVEIAQAESLQFLNRTDTPTLRRMLAGAPVFAIGWRIHARFPTVQHFVLSRLPFGCRTACLS